MKRNVFDHTRRRDILFRALTFAAVFSMMLILCDAVWLRSACAAQKESVPCIVGYSEQTVPDIDSRDLEAAFRLWSQELASQYGFNVETILYGSTEKLIADFLAKKLDFVGMTSIEFLRAAKTLKVKPEMTQYRNGKSVVRYLVLADASVQKKGLAGLKNKKLSILKNNTLAQMFLDTSLMKAGLVSSESFFSAVQEKSKESQAILDVFFGKSDICIVTDSAFQTMKEMNPQVGYKLRVMAESPELVATIGFFRPDWPPEYKQRAMEVLKSDVLKRHERGKQITLLFNIEKVDVLYEEQLDSIKKLLADYDRLRKRI